MRKLILLSSWLGACSASSSPSLIDALAAGDGAPIVDAASRADSSSSGGQTGDGGLGTGGAPGDARLSDVAADGPLVASDGPLMDRLDVADAFDVAPDGPGLTPWPAPAGQPGAGGWTAAAALETRPRGENAHSPAVAIDDDGNAFLVWEHGRAVWAQWRRAGSGWSAPAVLDDRPGYEAYSPEVQIATDGAGHAIALWSPGAPAEPATSDDGIAGVWASLFDGALWSPRKRLTDKTALQLRLAWSQSGEAVAAWVEKGEGAVRVAWFRQATGWSSGATLGGAPVSPGLLAAGVLRATIDGQGRALVVWLRGNGDLSSATGTAKTGFTAPVKAASVRSADGFDLAREPAGRALLVWRTLTPTDDDVEVRAAFFHPTAGFAPSVVVDSVPVVVTFQGPPVAAIDRLGNAFALWIENYISLIVQQRHYVDGQGWQPIAHVEEIADVPTGSAGLSAAVDGFGRLTATWSKRDPGSQASSVWTTRFTPAGGWETPALLEHETAESVSTPSLSVAYGGRAFVAWSYGFPGSSGVIWGAFRE